MKQHDPETYVRLSLAKPDAKTANADIEAFYEAVSKAREEHGVPDVLVVVRVNVHYASVVAPAMSSALFGAAAEAEALAAYAYGFHAAQRREMLNKLLGGTGTTKNPL